VGNFGPNPDNPSGHLMVENGNLRKKPILEKPLGNSSDTLWHEFSIVAITRSLGALLAKILWWGTQKHFKGPGT